MAVLFASPIAKSLRATLGGARIALEHVEHGTSAHEAFSKAELASAIAVCKRDPGFKSTKARAHAIDAQLRVYCAFANLADCARAI